MKAIEFLYGAGKYNPGETAGMPDEQADDLVSKGVARYAQAVPHRKMTKAGGGEAAPLSESGSPTGQGTQSSSRGPGRPRKQTSSNTSGGGASR